MATLAIGIVGGDMPWPLVVVGVCFGIALIMMQVKSPMLVAVGMYLPFETTFAIFLGGVFRTRRLARQAARFQSRANGTRGERRSAHRFRANRRRVPARLGLGRHRSRSQEPQLGNTPDIFPPLVSRGTRRNGRIGRYHDLDSTHKRR